MIPNRGAFISFEGGEGSGKTTQIASLRSRLDSMGIGCLTTCEPGGTKTGVIIRQLILDPECTHILPKTELFLYAADRCQNVNELILPALNANKVVVSDRFIDSSLAYQGYGRGIDLDFIRSLMKLATGGLKPGLTLYLDLDPLGAKQRIAKRGSKFGELGDRLERAPIDFHERVRAGYLELAKKEPDRIKIVSGGSKSEVESKVWEQVSAFLRKSGYEIPI